MTRTWLCDEAVQSMFDVATAPLQAPETPREGSA